ncbi:MAG: NADP-dependent oxidoreductase [Halioglobus sp.]
MNTRVILSSRPTGEATRDCFSVKTEELEDLPQDMVRVAVEYISVDAGTRTMLKGEGFHNQVGMGDTVLAGGVGRIIASNADGWEVGQAVRGRLCAQTIATVSPTELEHIDEAAPISSHLGILSPSTGVTAWIGMRNVAKPAAGDTFVVSAAAGAVGSIVGQIAKIDGARVIGIAGGQRKKDYLLNQLNFDEAIDYKNEDVNARLRELAPEGVNVFFDNVGGPVLDAVLDNLAMRARVVICGAVSQYNDMDNVTGPAMYLRLAERQSTMEGFAFFHFPESFAAAATELAQWQADGRVVLPEEILEGIERYPEALEFMFAGGNLGKLLVKAS